MATSTTLRILATAHPDHLCSWPATSLATTAASHHRIVVLDSSHNPPTRAHAALLAAALDTTSSQPKTNTAALVLLSTANADKGRVAATDTPHRAAMMLAVAQHLSSSPSSAPPAIAVATTAHALFVDKARDLDAWLRASPHHHQSSSVDWIVGHDTLARLLDPRYYLSPSSDGDHTGHMRTLLEDQWLVPTRSRLLVAARPAASSNDDNMTLPPDAARLADRWRRRGWLVDLVVPDPDITTGVSSSRVRAAVLAGDPRWRDLVLEPVAEIIARERLYHPAPPQ
ncbi:hypothetical protein BC828DRAFT_372190 [Blastocladiella britannica]|nr:hypothetical protein BC828DRAFT_372190 [Blastocladiella britannica]